MTTNTLQTTAPPALKVESDGGIDLEKTPVEKVVAKLGVQVDRGLTSTDAQRRLAQYGPNALVEKERGLAARIAGYFMGPIAYMIEAAAIVSAILGRWEDFIIITALLGFNAGLELWQDMKASNALAALKKGLAPEATALRDGKWQTVQASTLVPGDAWA
jgi:H+-transporting ATPase